MSLSDSDSSSYGGEYKNFKQISRDRLLLQMLRSAKTGNSESTSKVLIMDELTVKIMSYTCKMADITEQGVSLVEDLYKRRQPHPSMDAIYFIQPTKYSVMAFMSDMAGGSPLYRKAFVFFSSPIPIDLLTRIERDETVLPRIGALHEMNLEYIAIDSQGFITNNERALEELFGDAEGTREGVACLNVMATRIATVFASLKEFPFVRYRAAKSLDATMMTTFRDLIPTKLAAGVWDCLTKYKKTIPNFPETETCELLILDRSVDQIAPFIHEWTYDAMCHDLLDMEGNKYVLEVPGKTGGLPEKKEVLLEDHDPIWLELRHAHIADATRLLFDNMITFVTRNKGSQIQLGLGSGSSGLSTGDLQKIIQALPQYSEQIDTLSFHIEIAVKINKIIREQWLSEIGQLEQDLVFGDAGMEDVSKHLCAIDGHMWDTTCENKLRLLMILAAIYPEQIEGKNGELLMKFAKLQPDDMNAVYNLRLLGAASDAKKSSMSPFPLKFDMQKKKGTSTENWQLSRFDPIIEELIEKLCKCELSKEDYPCLNDPSPTFEGTSIHQPPAAHSVRTRCWPPRDDSFGDLLLRRAYSNSKKMGHRIFVFIVGGAARSELRVCHKLTTKLKREIILGSSSIDDPPQFLKKLKSLTAHELTLDDLQI